MGRYFDTKAALRVDGAATVATERRRLPQLSQDGDAQSEDLRAEFEERAALLEYDQGLSRKEAELEAARITGWRAEPPGRI